MFGGPCGLGRSKHIFILSKILNWWNDMRKKKEQSHKQFPHTSKEQLTEWSGILSSTKERDERDFHKTFWWMALR